MRKPENAPGLWYNEVDKSEFVQENTMALNIAKTFVWEIK
jgi:hypothetical protein